MLSKHASQKPQHALQITSTCELQLKYYCEHNTLMGWRMSDCSVSSQLTRRAVLTGEVRSYLTLWPILGVFALVGHAVAVGNVDGGAG